MSSKKDITEYDLPFTYYVKTRMKKVYKNKRRIEVPESLDDAINRTIDYIDYKFTDKEIKIELSSKDTKRNVAEIIISSIY